MGKQIRILLVIIIVIAIGIGAYFGYIEFFAKGTPIDETDSPGDKMKLRPPDLSGGWVKVKGKDPRKFYPTNRMSVKNSFIRNWVMKRNISLGRFEYLADRVHFKNYVNDEKKAEELGNKLGYNLDLDKFKDTPGYGGFVITEVKGFTNKELVLEGEAVFVIINNELHIPEKVVEKNKEK